jgi:hypothetical protein
MAALKQKARVARRATLTGLGWRLGATRTGRNDMNRFESRQTRSWLAAGLLAAAILMGCAQDVGTIDRTQHNIVRKADILGKEFYYRTTVLTTPFSSAYSTIGDQGRLERGVFEVQEDYLHFFRTYEWKEGSEHFGAKSDTDTPLLDANGQPVTYDACVDRAGRIFALEDCGSHGGTIQKVPVWVYRGSPLASFPIESHFDTIWSYNPTTGERTNVKVEDTSDRQWFEREFMRVHWGNGEVLNYSRLMLMGLRQEYPETVDIAPWADPTAEVSNPGTSLLRGFTIYKGEADQPRYQPKTKLRAVDGNPAETTIEYMDFVSHWVLPAPTIFYEYWNENVPLCWFYPWYAGGIFECASEELAVRTSFLEVPRDDRYASVDYDDTMLEKFGYYRAERQYYDRVWDSTYHGQIQKAFLHPIWQAGRDDAGKRIPMAQRTPQPIVYYLSEGYPRELVDESVELAHQWSEPFETIVAHYKGAQWWSGVSGLTADNAAMFLLCENNDAEAQAALDGGATFFAPGETPGPQVNGVAWHGIQGQPGFHPLCQDMADVKYNGDLRYNQLHAVVPPLMNGLLGFGPPSADPLTGRIVSANAYNYLGTMRQYADSTMDVIETMVGVRNIAEYTSGRYIREDQKVKRAAIETNDGAITTPEAMAMAAAMVTPAVHARVTTLGIEKSDVDWAQARLSIIKANPGLNRMLVDDSVRMLFRDPTVGLGGAGLDARTLARMSPANWAHAEGFRRNMKFKLAAAERGIDLLGFADPAIGGYIEEYRQKFDQAVCAHFADKGSEYLFDYAVFDDVKVDADSATGRCATEGERDQQGWTCTFLDHGAYQGNFWVNTCTTAKLMAQIRRRIIDDEYLDSRAYWGPDALYTDSRDPLVSRTQLEMRRLLAELRSGYVAEIFQKMYLAIAIHEVGHNLGLRHNFTASTDALNYPREYWELKAGVVPGSGGQTFAGGVYKPSTDAYLWQRETKTQQARNLRQLQSASIMDYGAKFNSEFEGVGHYDQAAIKFGYGNLVETFRSAPKNLQQFYDRGYLRSPQEGAPFNTGVEYKGADKMEELFKRVHYTQLPNAFGEDDSALDAMYDRVDVEWQNLTEAQQEVPYRYCEGDRIGADPLCWTRDSGADAFEIVTNEMDDHESYDWFVYGYGHDSTLFWPENYYNRVRSSYWVGKIQYQWWALNYAYFNHNDWWANGPGKGRGPAGEDLPWHMDKNGGLSMTLAAGAAYDKIAGAFGRPIEGQFGYNRRTNRYEAVQDLNPEGLVNQFRVYEDDGARPMYAGWSNEGYDIYPIHAGAIYDRMAAFEMLTDPTTWFFGIDDVADTTRFRVSFYTMFPEPMLKLLGGLMTGEVEGYGWCVPLDERGTPMQKNGRYQLRQRSVLWEPSCEDHEIPLDPEGDYTFPTTKYRIPMLAAYFGMSLMITDYDRSFMDVSRIFLEGHGSAVELPDGVEVAKFEHPFTGKIYVAYKSGLEDEYTPAWYLIQEANRALDAFRLPNGTIDTARLAASYERSDLEFATGKLELVRAMHQLYDYSQEGAQAQGGGY